MTTVNPFDLLGGDDNDDPSQLIAAAQQQKVVSSAPPADAIGGGKKSPAATAKMPTKPVPPSQAVREARNAADAPPRGGAGRGVSGRGRGRGAGRGPNRDFGNMSENGFTGGYGGANGGIVEEGDGGKSLEKSRSYPPRQPFRGGRRGGYGNADGEAGGDSEQPSRRIYERRSGTGRGYEMKREGAGRANWGTVTDDVIAQVTEEDVNAEEKVTAPEQQLEQEDGKPLAGDKNNKENATNEEEMKPEDKEMTLEEYEKIKEEKRKALLAMKAEERKVTIDKELESMKQLSMKKANDEIFIKLGTDKESKKKDAEREERAKKSLSINEFLKPAEGERSYGRGRGRGRGDRGRGGGFGGGGGGGGGFGATASQPAPAIEDDGQFPTLGAK